jgi:hypothetical protein
MVGSSSFVELSPDVAPKVGQLAGQRINLVAVLVGIAACTGGICRGDIPTLHRVVSLHNVETALVGVVNIVHWLTVS